ncbi:hypothetical protein N9Y42_05710 [Mariniblastus sp.]|nr:hypothetical protein [Mariniblastus sp.]
MRRFRKNRNQPSVSLFPFLAVLICTLGVLIVMLVLAVKSAEVAKEENQATQDQAAAEKIEEAKQRLALEQFRSESIHDIRADVLARLATSRGNRSYLQQDVSDATKELDATSKQLQALKKSLANANKTNPVVSDQSEVQAKKAAIAKLTQQIATAKQALADQQKKSKQQGPSRFSLVPFRGSGGTFRRPIFLECLKNEVRLQPLGITLSKQDFALPIRAGNPLDVALLTIQEHWQQLDVAGEQGSPYPLLVVRPGGAETFVLARRAMKSWADEFGYELVDAEKDLDFGTRDNVLASKVDNVIQQSIQRQMQLAQQMYERERHLSKFASSRVAPGFSVSKRGGGAVTTSAYQSAAGGRNVSPVGFDSNREQTGTQRGTADARRTSYLSNRNSAQARSTAEFAQRQSGSNQNPQSQFGSSQTNHPGTSQKFSASNRSAGQRSDRPDGSTGTSNRFSSQGNMSGGNLSQPGSQTSNSQQSGSQTGSNSSSPNLANRRGSGWALPSRNQGGTGYLRPITVVCSADHLRIKTASGQERTIDFKSGSVAAVDVMVEEIWKRIDSWGIAGQGSFWKPQLRIQVSPGGEQRFATLQHMLQNSGLVIDTGANQ